MKETLENLTPKEIVKELDKYIIGQEKAKKAVAIALRNRMRRQMLPKDLREEIAPKNIIMIGPTGVGKTEIARRLSKLVHAPFIKVEATKYTEVGYVGRDVESMVRDLLSVAITMVKKELSEGVREEAAKRTEEIILDLLLPGVKSAVKSEAPRPAGPALPIWVDKSEAETGKKPSDIKQEDEKQEDEKKAEKEIEEQKIDYQEDKSKGPMEAEDKANGPKTSSTREKFREMLKAGKLDRKMVEIDVTKSAAPAIEIFSNTNFEEMDVNFGPLANLFGGKKKKKRVTVDQAKEIILAQEMDKLVDDDRAAEIAKERVEEMGIIFIDEIDKVASKEGRYGADISREGVQRDILPIVEGSQVNTKYGIVDTSHILFIAAGAFHTSKPSDLIPELQGRFPLRVELEDLGTEDFHKILTQPENSLTKQYRELLKTEEVTLIFTEEATRRISEIAASVNSKTENIGARRLHTIMELLLEDVSFNAPDLKGQKIPITPEYVEDKLAHVLQDQDLSRYIL